MDPQYPFCSGTSSSNTCLRFLGIFIATVASTARCQHLSTNSIHTALSESTSSPSSLSWESAWIVPADQQLVEVTDLGVHSLKTKIDLPRCSEYFSIVIVMKLSHLIWINSWKVNPLKQWQWQGTLQLQHRSPLELSVWPRHLIQFQTKTHHQDRTVSFRHC